MSGPRRLMHSADPLTRQLIAAAQGEEPEPKAMSRTLAATTAATLASTSASAGASTAAGAGKVLSLVGDSVAPASSGLVLTKILAGTAVVATLAGAGVGLFSGSVEEEMPPASAAGMQPQTTPNDEAPKESAPNESKTEARQSHEVAHPKQTTQSKVGQREPNPARGATAASSSSARSRASNARRTTTPVTSSAAKVQSLRREVNLLDRVRSALRRGESEQALGLLDSYARRFPNGELQQESLVLRAEVLQRLGREKAARQQAQRLIEADPTGPHAARARAILRGKDSSDAR